MNASYVHNSQVSRPPTVRCSNWVL